MKLIKFILFLFGFLPCIIHAQLNESDSINWKGNLSITGFLQSGNVQTEIFRSKAEFIYKPVRTFAFKTTNSYVYQEFGGLKADEDFLSLNFLYLHPEATITPLALGFVSSNFRREINLRSLLGLGVTFKLLKKNKSWIKCSLSSEYEQTQFKKSLFNQSEYNGNDFISTVRGTFWIRGKYYLFHQKLIFSHESYYQPSLEENNNFRWSADLGLELPIWKFLNFKINYLHTYESVVVLGQHEEDRIVSFGFILKSHP